MKNVLVTGGAGYIGSHAAKLLAKENLNPVVLDNLDRGHKEAVKWGPFEKADLSDRKKTKEIFKKHKIEAVIHFAAHSAVGESVKNPALYFRNNVVNSLELLEAMREADVRNIVFSSTAAVYGNPKKVPIVEEAEKLPVNPYGDTKLFIEKMLEGYAAAYGFKWAALRYFNAAGADPDGEIGERHADETHLIPLILFTLLGKRDSIGIFGTDYPTPDGTAVRDYIHVTDLADAHLKALRYLEEDGKNTAMNLGTGKGYSVKEVIRTVEKVTGKKIPAKEAPRREGDPAELVASSKKAKAVLKWTPKYSDLETIVRTAWQWHQKNK